MIAIPAVAVGQHLGNRIHLRISNDKALRVIGMPPIPSGLSLAAKVWF